MQQAALPLAVMQCTTAYPCPPEKVGLNVIPLLAERYGRRWDATGQVPWFAFRDSAGGWRQGYYDDPASLRVKYDAVNRHDLAGIGIWSLGMDTGVNDLWNVIEDRFSKVQIRLSGADRYATAAAVSR